MRRRSVWALKPRRPASSSTRARRSDASQREKPGIEPIEWLMVLRLSPVGRVGEGVRSVLAAASTTAGERSPMLSMFAQSISRRMFRSCASMVSGAVPLVLR